ncbi:energy transducer TonB [Granulicella sp. WH15]|uniref:energy transducer TonB n=1 Tax=Granulicella sp. WH15 TaxID=2602070 RepID=UPI0013677685|nr:energy transducer TonB [Granulicella sp. WH15]QHN04657.1 energy transducer TonB [Granulicella sp. WH15]
MPILDLPSNPPPPESPEPVVLRSNRYGELAEHELVRLLDTLDDDRARSRFRESIYISVIVYLIIGWFLVYGPRVLFHQGKIVNPADVLKARELTELTTPKDITRHHLARNPPALDQKTIKQLQATRKPTPQPPAPAPKAAPAPTPQPQAATPPPPPPPPAATHETPQPRLAPTPQPQQQAAIPDSPRPAPTRPNFSSPNQNPGDAIRQAARDAARAGAAGGDYGASAVTHAGGADLGSGMEVLSDTQGVDFDAYFRRLKREIYNTWIPLIPEEARPPLNKRGITQIRFTILPDGKIGAMHLDGSTHDTAIDRAAWGSIVGVGQFQALPAGYHGNLELRFTYYVNTEPK